MCGTSSLYVQVIYKEICIHSSPLQPLQVDFEVFLVCDNQASNYLLPCDYQWVLRHIKQVLHE